MGEGEKGRIERTWSPITIRFHICKLSYVIKSIHNSRSNTCSADHAHARSREKLESLNAHIPSRARQRSAFLLSLPYCKWRLPCFLQLLCSLLEMFQIVPPMMLECCLGFLSVRQLWCALWRKHVWEKLCSGLSYDAVGSEVNVNESTVYIKQGVFEQKHLRK